MEQDAAAARFRQIVVPHLADALALARWLTGSPTDAEDVVQEAAMRALGAVAAYRGGSPRAWLLAITRNTAFSWLARQRSGKLVMVGDLADIDSLAQGTAAGGADPRPSAEAALIRRADHAAVAAALARLALPMREVVVLRDINGCSYQEIAEVLDLPLGTVMSRLARGRRQLALLLAEAEQ